MQLLRFNDKETLAFGLVWEGHDQIDHTLHAQIKIWRSKGYTLACKYSRLGDYIYGLDPGQQSPTSRPTKAKMISGAGLIATHPAIAGQTGLVVVEVQHGNDPILIMVGVKNGIVVFDRLAELSDVDELRHQFVTLLPRDTALVTWGTVSSLALAIDHAFSFEDIVQSSKKRFNQLALRPLRSVQPLLITGALIGIAAVLGGAWMAWDYFEAQQKASHSSRLAASNTPAVLYQQEINKLLALPITPASLAVAAVREQLADFPLLAAGWRLEAIECQNKSCSASWMRKEGTLAEFQSDAEVNHPDWSGIQLVTLDKLVHTLPIRLPEGKLPAAKDWHSTKTFSERTYSLWQSLKPIGWSATLASPVQQAIPPGIPSEQAKSLIGFTGAPMAMPLDISGQAWWWALPDEHSPVNGNYLGANVALSGPIVLAFDGSEIKFSLKALVYVQP